MSPESAREIFKEAMLHWGGMDLARRMWRLYHRITCHQRVRRSWLVRPEEAEICVRMEFRASAYGGDMVHFLFFDSGKSRKQRFRKDFAARTEAVEVGDLFEAFSAMGELWKELEKARSELYREAAAHGWGRLESPCAVQGLVKGEEKAVKADYRLYLLRPGKETVFTELFTEPFMFRHVERLEGGKGPWPVFKDDRLFPVEEAWKGRGAS